MSLLATVNHNGTISKAIVKQHASDIESVHFRTIRESRERYQRRRIDLVGTKRFENG